MNFFKNSVVLRQVLFHPVIKEGKGINKRTFIHADKDTL